MMSATTTPSSKPPNNKGGSSSGQRIVVVGSANYDMTTYTATFPQLGETVLGQRFETSCGGKGSNQAIAAAKLCVSPVTMICRVGSDVFGQALLENFQTAGVDLDSSNCVLPHISTGVAAITVDTRSGDNQIIVTPGANHCLTPSMVEAALLQIPNPPSIVIVQLEIPYESALQALKTAKQLGALTIFNPAPAPDDGKSLDGFYQYTDIMIPNETELRKITGASDEHNGDNDTVGEVQLAQRLLDKGVGMAVVVTLGARGAMVISRQADDKQVGEPYLVQAPNDLPCKDDPVVDTIGAGDAFCGALASYLSGGVNLVDAAQRACGVAGISVRRRGASYPDPSELPDSLKLECHHHHHHHHHHGQSTSSPSSLSTQSQKPPIVFVTGNKNKLEEVKQILAREGSLPFEIVSQSIDLPELQGDPITIATEKCRIAAQQVHGACLTEDTSLSFNALNGMPGPFIKWFLEKCGHDGLNAMLNGFDDKSAYAQTVVAFTMGPGEEIHIFDGRTQGSIVPARGSLDFGWDPIFEPHEGNGNTYAEMSKDAKNAISHRGRAFAKLHAFLRDNNAGQFKTKQLPL